MIRWESLAEELAPWRALGRHSPSRTAVRALRQECLDEVAGVDPLASPGGRTLVAGPWRGDVAWAASALASAAQAGCRVLVQLGDLGFGNGEQADAYLDGLEAACRSTGVTLCWLDGHDDDDERLARFGVSPHGLRAVRPHVWHVPRGHRWQWGGRAWLAVGAVLIDAEAEQIAAGGPADVLLGHQCPAMVASADGALLQGVVDAVRPTRLLHGRGPHDAVVDPTPWGGACHVTGLGPQGRADNLLAVELSAP